MLKNKQLLVMIGTRFDTMGGVSSVVNVYRNAGLFELFSILYIPTHKDGGFFNKFLIATCSLVKYLFLVITGQICLLHVHVSSRASFWRKSCFLLVAYIFGLPTIIHLHGSEFAIFYEQECGSFKKRFVRFIFNNASRIIVLSSAWNIWVQGISTNSNIISIYNPVILPEQPLPWNARIPHRILFLGRLGKRKGVYDLIDAIKILDKKYLDLMLILGGDGEHKKVLSYLSDIGVSEQVDLIGWVKGIDKDNLLASAVLYVLPSYNEGLPMSILEAMACGLPIISTPIGGIPEAVTDGVEGFLVNPGDINAIANRIVQILSEPGLAERMGAASRLKIESTFSADVILPQVEKLYRDLGVS